MISRQLGAGGATCRRRWTAGRVEATVAWADVVPWAEASDGSLFLRESQPLTDESADHLDEVRIGSRRLRAGHGNFPFLAELRGLFIKIKQHFHVIADESNRRHDDRA